jgi:hypothetical protein
MALALSSERYPLWKRDCPELKDVDFIELGLLRCISTVDGGSRAIRKKVPTVKYTLRALFMR